MVNLNSNGKRALESGIAFTVIATIAVALRLLTKRYTKIKWAADDSWAVVSLVALFGWITAQFWGL